MMCSRLLRHQSTQGASFGVSHAFHGAIDWSVEIYRRTLEWVLWHEKLTLLVTAATLVATIWLYVIIPKGFLPLQDTGLIFAVMEGGQEISFTEMKRLQGVVESAIRKDPDVIGVVSVIGVTPINATPNAGRLAITLRSRDQRKATVTEIIGRLQRAVAAVPGTIVYFQPVQDIQISTRVSRAQFQYTLSGTDTDEVGIWGAKLAERMQSSPFLQNVASEAQDNGFRMQVQVDRETAGRLGVSMQTVVDTLNDAFGQRQISTIYGQSNQYRVILEAMPAYKNDPTALAKIYVPASGVQAIAQSTSLTSTAPVFIPSVSGSPMVPLSTARFEHTTALLVVAHQEAVPAVTISFNLLPCRARDAAADIARSGLDAIFGDRQLLRRCRRTANHSPANPGLSWPRRSRSTSFGVLYESFIHPLTILSTLPSAGVGALLALMLWRLDLSVVAGSASCC
jgi:multidrug efflux pump